MRIACKQPLPPEPPPQRSIKAALERMWINATKVAAKHNDKHFLPRQLPASVDSPFPYPCIGGEENIPSYIHPIDYRRVSALVAQTKRAPTLPHTAILASFKTRRWQR
jgi:hypothetical protein